MLTNDSVTVVLCVLWVVISLSILFYGRVLLVASQTDDFEVLRPRFPVSLTVLWFLLAGVDIFGILWAVVGVVWIYEANATGDCGDNLIDVS